MSVRLSICFYFSLSVYMPVCLYVCPSVCLSLKIAFHGVFEYFEKLRVFADKQDLALRQFNFFGALGLGKLKIN